MLVIVGNRPDPQSKISFLSCFNQRVKQNHLALFSRGKVVRSPLGDVADRSWPKGNSSSVDAQPSASLEHVAEHIFVAVLDLFRVGILYGLEGDQAGTEPPPFHQAYVADFLVDLLQMP